MLAIWSLVPLPFLKPAWTSGSSLFTYCWSLAWRILSITLLACVQFSCSVVSDSLWSHESQHARPPCPSPTPEVHSNSCPSSQWCHPAISSSVVLKWSLLTQFILHKEHFFQQGASMDSHKHKYRSNWILAMPLKSWCSHNPLTCLDAWQPRKLQMYVIKKAKGIFIQTHSPMVLNYGRKLIRRF